MSMLILLYIISSLIKRVKVGRGFLLINSLMTVTRPSQAGREKELIMGVPGNDLLVYAR